MFWQRAAASLPFEESMSRRPPLRLCPIVFHLVLSCGFIASAPYDSRGDEAASLANATRTIVADDLQQHVNVLADDSFEGREAGSRGGYAAAGYIVDKLKTYQVRPAGSGSDYYQLFGRGYRNILGMIPGADPNVGEEIVVVGAHYDHVGYGTPKNSFGPTGYIHNGADDNASGIAAILELAQAIHDGNLRPKRSLLLCFWDGEEKGLLGSKHWTNYPTQRLDRVVFAFNLDMIGQLREQGLEVHGTRTSTGLRRLVSQANEETDIPLQFSWELKDNSDHHSFFSRGIPTLMFHTGLHDKYHRPSDDADTVNAEGMQLVSRLAFRTIWDVCQAEVAWQFRARCTAESPEDQKRLHAPHPPLPPRLGIGWPTNFDVADGIPIASLRNGSPAARSGLRVGDRILALNGKPIEDLRRFQLRIHAAKSPVKLSVQRQNSDGPFEAQIELDGSPARIGFSWRPDTGDPQAVVITRITSGSAASHAGVQVGDHIYRVNGVPIESSDWLLQRLIHDDGPFHLELDRGGRYMQIKVEPLPPIQKSDI